ncbi:MAG TPA: helix-turn-helix transcriptional regulator [Coleofasciculaceae cyanobacterium]
MTQSQLSDALSEVLLALGAIGLPSDGQAIISKIETGLRSMSGFELLAIALILEVPPDVFAPWHDGSYEYRAKVQSDFTKVS